MKYLLFGIILSFSFNVSALETIGSKADAKSLAESVMQDVSSGKMKEGISRLRPFAVYPVAEFDAQAGQLDLQLPVISQRYGQTIGYDFVETQEIGDSVLQYIYLQKFEKHILIWKFIFYKPKDKWFLNTWSFNDSIRSLFKH